MTTPLNAAPTASSYGRDAAPALPPAREDEEPQTLHAEINARRARVENPELLQRLRGL